MGWSTNQKALEKRAKEKEKKDAIKREKEEKIESAKWKDDYTDKKKQINKEKEEKRQKQLERKKELKELAVTEEQEMEKQTKKKNQEFNAKKLTQAQIKARQQEALIKNYEKSLKNQQQQYFNEENPNHKFADYEIAETVEQALEILEEEKEDKHPEKRFKAAFDAFCQKREGMIKIDYPKLKRSQRIQMMKKQFEKHPDNPYNKKKKAYNFKADRKQQQDD